MKSNEELLEKEIRAEFERLKSLESGTEEHMKAVESLSKLYKIKLEGEKNDADIQLKIEQIEEDKKFKQKQISTEKESRKAKNVIELLGIGLPLVFYGVWMNKGFEFEKGGHVFTSPTFRGLTNKFKPTRK